MSKFLRQGLVAGAAGGVAMAVYLLVVVEPILAEAIAVEEQGAEVHQALFTRGAQQLGGAVGTVLYGAFLGVLLGATVALVRHRLRGDDWQRAVRVAATAFVSALLVPFLKYPPNPPGVGDPSTVGRRTALYVLFVGISVIAAWSGWRLSRTLAARGLPARVAVVAGATLYVVAMGVAGLLLPGSGNVVSLPAELVWRFRIASLGGTALLVAVTGVVLGWRLAQHPGAGVEEVVSRA